MYQVKKLLRIFIISWVAGSQCLRHGPLSLTHGRLHAIRLLAETRPNHNVPAVRLSFAMNKGKNPWYRHDVRLLVETGREDIKRTISQYKYAGNTFNHLAQLYTLLQ